MNCPTVVAAFPMREEERRANAKATAEKPCARCGVGRRASGDSYCLACRNEARRKHYAKWTPERKRAAYEKRKPRLNTYSKEYYQKHKAEIAARRRQLYQEKKEAREC